MKILVFGCRWPVDFELATFRNLNLAEIGLHRLSAQLLVVGLHQEEWQAQQNEDCGEE